VRALLAAAALTAALGPLPAAGQALSLGEGGEAVEIEATEALEWHSEQRLYVARGDARIRQGEVELRAETVSAYYRDGEGGTEIFRIVAEGGVIVATPTQSVSGAKGVYDADQDVFVMTGGALELKTPNETITARDSLEYWQGRGLAVARGGAAAVRGTDRLEADVISAELARVDGKLEIRTINALGNVLITTPTDIARGDEGVYNIETNLAMLSGSVQLTRGDNQLNGDFAEVNLATGVSRLIAQPGGGGRIRGLLVPE
jgi:lipopolysaccharide export system protein LptA